MGSPCFVPLGPFCAALRAWQLCPCTRGPWQSVVAKSRASSLRWGLSPGLEEAAPCCSLSRDVSHPGGAAFTEAVRSHVPGESQASSPVWQRWSSGPFPSPLRPRSCCQPSASELSPGVTLCGVRWAAAPVEALAAPRHTQQLWGLYLGGMDQMQPWCPPQLEQLCLSLACVELVSCWKSPR